MLGTAVDLCSDKYSSEYFKMNYSAYVHSNAGICQPSQQWCFLIVLGNNGAQTQSTQPILVRRIISLFGSFHWILWQQEKCKTPPDHLLLLVPKCMHCKVYFCCIFQAHITYWKRLHSLFHMAAYRNSVCVVKLRHAFPLQAVQTDRQTKAKPLQPAEVHEVEPKWIKNRFYKIIL